MLFGKDSWRLGDDLPRGPLMWFYGALLGLASSLIGVSGGSISNLVLSLYGKPIHNAVATSAGIGVPITIVGAIGYMLAGLSYVDRLPPLSVGFVSFIGFVVMAPVSSFTASYGARLAHRLQKRQLEIAFGIFLLAVGLRFIASVAVLGLPAHAQLVAAHFPAFEPVEKAHAEQIGLELPLLRDQRRHGAFG